MSSSVLALLSMSMAPLFAPAQTMFPVPLSERVVTYSIDVRLDPSQKMLRGAERLTWRNPSKDPVRELQFHLYLNAFKSSETTFMRESGGRRRGANIGDWGWIDITSLQQEDGTDLRATAEFIRPDDGNEHDQTVLRVPLPAPVPPGRSMTLLITFTARLPRVFARTGYAPGEFYLVGQWFPKIGVYEPAGMRYASSGGWNCHQFHSNTEFYADFGVYDVSMTVPDHFIVGATGVRISETKNADRTVTLRYHAEDIHDFAWTASPLFVETIDRWRHVTIRFLMQPQHTGQTARHIASIRATLEYLDAHVGPYPYPELTVVDPGWGGLAVSGMEYPMFITAGTFSFLPEGLRVPELIAVHEFSHNYFYGMLASNEFEEAWLDEGLNQYFETRIMDAAYGPGSSVIDFWGFHFGDHAFTRIGYAGMQNPRIAPTATFAWMMPRGSYGALTYNKPAVFLSTLEGMIGLPAMDSVMRTYFRRWSFRHPSGKDFIAVVNDVVPRIHGDRFGTDLNWFFDQVLYGTGICDYELSSISVTNQGLPRGIMDSDTGKVIVTGVSDTAAALPYASVVTVSRLGEITLPVDVQIRFSDGSEIVEHWDGKGRISVFRYLRPARAVWAAVDPARKLPLDVNYTNNTRAVEPQHGVVWKYALKILFWMQNLLHLAAIFV